MKRAEIIKGDITTLEVDAIVNAANSSLLGGGGIDGAIHRAGGPEILNECREILKRHGECAPGQAVVTSAGRMKAKYVIHAVGPVWRGGNEHEDSLLAAVYTNCLGLARQHEVETIAFPNISTGVYGFPKGRAAEVATDAVRRFLIHKARYFLLL